MIGLHLHHARQLAQHQQENDMNQKLAILGIAIGLLVAGWLDGKDHQMARQYAISQQGQKIACIDCAGGVR